MTLRSYRRPVAALALLAGAALAACTPSDEDQAEAVIDDIAQSYGNCTVSNVGSLSTEGVSAYRWLKSPLGSALAVQCASVGPFRDDVTLILPNLSERGTLKPGEYRVLDRDSAVVTELGAADVAFADLSQELDTITTYRATAGTVKIVEYRSADSVVVGTYVLSLRRLAGSDRAPMVSSVGGAFAARVAPEIATGGQR